MYPPYSSHYAGSPHCNMGYEYHTSSTTPPPPGYGYYSPRYYTTSTPKTCSSKHTRRATQDYSYPSAKTTSYYYPDSYGYSSGYTRKPEHHTPPPQYSEADEHPYYQHHQSTPQPRPEPQPRKQRASSYSAPRQSAPREAPPKPRQQAPPKRAVATDRDARAAGIPAGYNFKNWDPNEEPILLLGSVFDANSLGKWIYDWTVAFHGPSTPITEMAGDLWLSLIQLAGKIKRAEESMPRIRRRDDRELIDDFLDSGERLWERFNKLLKVCEKHMLKTAKRDRGSEKLYMGNNSGREFVETIFGRDRELERTEKLTTGIRLWSMRFDANCEDVLRTSKGR
ncbi:hypothetical protein M436DRAFT_48351 [Aureobasidium namibiae CBS 147.97]|uniref:Vegetative cell wall protein gp1 n=1 Tax=Aureobasidium namibiae CBS 147.97 TaxID=1043004 RepID=A0A074WI31_9PEZI|nr:uncharacterized protein M436DRAFT_48351 [Aureobasidium namibiae CBS 147.97]KEQ72693.1 hypothetical protein M436DRAFT_48351 [Aureobasidium namibiae CBS 147.97]